MAVFFTSLLPQFAPAGDASFAALLGLGLLFCAMTLAWLAGYAVVVAKAGQVLARPGSAASSRASRAPCWWRSDLGSRSGQR